MAAKQEVKVQVIEKEYVIPLRREWMKVSRYKRTAKSVKAIKQYVARHMRVPDRDLSKVKLDIYLNNELWFRGVKHPPNKIKVRVKKEGQIVRVELVNIPNEVRFSRLRQEKIHKKIEKEKEAKTEEKPKEKVSEEDKKKTEGEDKVEKEKTETEKEKSVEHANIKLAEQAAKAQKHTVKGKGPQVQRKALKK